jgi:TM2 domain-containing membrane protein YozV
MSSIVSQLDYWLSDSTFNNLEGLFNASKGGPGGAFLSYDVFLGLSVLGGFLALDHLYLRSPLTFLAKLIINIMFLGVWWIYDASQAVFNTDVVKVFGLGVPGMGPKGIGAGVLANDVPDQKHMAFFYYGVALFFGGLFGVDSFLVGDQRSGLIRLVCTITLILAPVSIFWWLYNLFYFIFKTKDVTDQYSEYFGSPSTSYFSMLGSQFPIIGRFFQAATVLKPVVETVKAGIDTVDTALSTVKQGVELGKTVVEKGASVAGQAISTASETAKAATSAFALAPAAATLSDGLTPPTIQKVIDQYQQKGGAEELVESGSLLSYVFLGTLGIIAVSGMVLTYLRSKQNGPPSKDDSPPEPGVLRKPDQEKSNRST